MCFECICLHGSHAPAHHRLGADQALIIQALTGHTKRLHPLDAHLRAHIHASARTHAHTHTQAHPRTCPRNHADAHTPRTNTRTHAGKHGAPHRLSKRPSVTTLKGHERHVGKILQGIRDRSPRVAGAARRSPKGTCCETLLNIIEHLLPPPRITLSPGIALRSWGLCLVVFGSARCEI